MTVEIPEHLFARLQSQAENLGYSPEEWLRAILTQTLAPKPPLRSSLGILAEYGPAPTEEEIDQNRAEMLGQIPRSR